MKRYRLLILSFCSISLMLVFNKCKWGDTENKNPIISLVSHPDSLIYVNDTCLNIFCEAFDPDDKITKVELYIDELLIGTLNTEPFIFQMCVTYIDVGMHEIKLKVYDNNGGIGYNESRIKIKDYKETNYGVFEFMTIKKYKQFNSSYEYYPDTSYFEGRIRQFHDSDKFNCEVYARQWDDTKNQLITIEFQLNKLTVTKINSAGEFESYRSYGNSYQGGKFVNKDMISFVYGTGGLGAGYDYKIIGVRK